MNSGKAQMRKPMRSCNNLSKAVLNTGKSCNIIRCDVIKKRVEVINLVATNAVAMVLATEREI